MNYNYLMDPVELSLFSSRINSICEEMGAILRRTAFSPNIKDRLDYSCAIFDSRGRLCAQAAHIPVHLGSMAYAMQGITEAIEWSEGDMMILNDPFRGGTHLPDITVIAPFFHHSRLCGFVANRAHHADAGCDTPGSMPLSSSLEEEGIIIPPVKILEQGILSEQTMFTLLKNSRNPIASRGDFNAQISANLCGINRLHELIETLGNKNWQSTLKHLNDYAERLASRHLSKLPDGNFHYTDWMDDDGQGQTRIPISAEIRCNHGKIHVDFSGTATQVKGNINCPLPVTVAAVYYVFYCLMPPNTPACDGCFRSISITAPERSLVNAQYPAAVVAGNVETSTRIVDVILGALAQAIPDQIPAASHGSMNNVAMGSNNWAYYETLGGGMGGHSRAKGFSAIQTHMTNTLNTPIEVVEMNFPLKINTYSIREHSAGLGKNPGGHGLIREYEFLQKTTVTLLTERRTTSPWSLLGGGVAKRGINLLNNQPLPAKTEFTAKPGDRLRIMTAGGGGWGNPDT